MAHMKSARKRANQSEKRRVRNRIIKSRVKTLTKKFLAALETGDAGVINNSLNAVVREVSKAATKGVIKKNNASRRISKLMKKANQALAVASSEKQPSV